LSLLNVFTIEIAQINFQISIFLSESWRYKNRWTFFGRLSRPRNYCAV